MHVRHGLSGWHVRYGWVDGHLPEAGEVVAALPLLDVRGGDVVDQVFLLRELPATVPPLAGKHTSALTTLRSQFGDHHD